MEFFFAGDTDKSIDVFIQDSSSATGAGLTGLAHNTASLVCYYRKGATGSATALTLASQTVGGAHTDGGFVEISSANMPGHYRLDLSDGMIDTQGYLHIQLKGATNMAPVSLRIPVLHANRGMTGTAVPAAAVEAPGGLFTRGSGAGQINQSADGQIDVNLVRWQNDAQSATDGKDFFDEGYNPTTNRVEGMADLETAVNDLGLAIADIDSVVTNGTHGNAAIKALIDILQTSVTNLNNLSAKCNLFGPAVMEIPDSGSTVFSFKMVVRDDEDKLVNLDGTPTLIATNAAGDNRAANLSAVSNPATGEYAFTYTVADSHLSEAMVIEAAGTISGEARKAYYRGFVADYDQGSTINTILTNLNALITTAGTPSNFGSGASLARNLVDTYALLEGVDDTTQQTQSDVNTLMGRITATLFSGITSIGDWIRRITRKDAGTAGMTTALNEINTGATSTYSTDDTTESIRDNLSGGGGGGGTGANSVNPTVDDGTDPVEGAKIRFTKFPFSHLQETEADGQPPTPFGLDNGTWDVVITADGYDSIVTTLLVDGNKTPTYPLTLNVITPAISDDVVTAFLVTKVEGALVPGVPCVATCTCVPDGNGLAGIQSPQSGASGNDGVFTFNAWKGACYRITIGDTDYDVVIPVDAEHPYPVTNQLIQ